MVTPSRNFKKLVLQELTETKSIETGATNSNWTDVTEINISITRVKQTLVIDKVRRVVQSYKGLTKSNLLKADITRLIDKNANECYLVKDVIESIWNNIDLEKIEVY